MKFQFIERNRSSLPVKKMCHVLEVSQSGYYHWRKAPTSNRKAEKERFRARIKKLYEEHKGMIGSPMLTADLHDDSEFSKVSRTRVARHMKDMGLKCRYVKKFVVTTDSKHDEPVAPNLLNRQFSTPAPDIVYVSDITYLKIGRKWHYLTVFIDLFSRIIVGWDLSDVNRMMIIQLMGGIPSLAITYFLSINLYRQTGRIYLSAIMFAAIQVWFQMTALVAYV